MGYKEPLSEGEVHSVNTKALREWIEKSRSTIKASPNETLLYSGREYDLDVDKDLSKEDREKFLGTPMWKRIGEMKRQLTKQKIPVNFKTLEDVLAGIRSHPDIVDKDRRPHSFASAFECFHVLEAKAALVPRVVVRACWQRMSQIYAENAKGDVKILDGAADDFGALREDKVFINRELEALLRNKNLSEMGKKVLKEKISKYGSYFDRRYTDLLRKLDENRKVLTRK